MLQRIPGLFILFAILCSFRTYVEGSVSQTSPLNPINFQFHHREQLIISDASDGVEEEDYDYDDPLEKRSIRKRRSAKWSPNYDLYEQWAEEYYAQYESAEEAPAGANEPKADLLDKLIQKTRNKTQEELDSERQQEEKKKEAVKNLILLGSWAFCIIILLCCVNTFVKRCCAKLACDFCEVTSFKKKMEKLVDNFVPGVYIHKNEEKEYYIPTEEELEALKEVQKLLFVV